MRQKKEVLLTSEGFLELETELNNLKSVERPRIIEAIKESQAKVLYICNLFTQVGVTDHFTVSDHIKAIENYVGKDGVDCVIVNNEDISDEFIKKYREEENKEFVITDENNLKKMHCEVIRSKLITTEDGTVKHDTLKLSSIIFSYLFR